MDNQTVTPMNKPHVQVVHSSETWAEYNGHAGYFNLEMASTVCETGRQL